MNSLVLGQFNSEKCWRGEGLARLPHISDCNTQTLIGCMDEMLFPFCDKGDILLCRYGFDPCLKNYLECIGCDFVSNKEPLEQCNDEASLNVFELISKYPERVADIDFDKDTTVQPYSVVHGLSHMAHVLKVYLDVPALESVIKVNSKIYSCQLAHLLDVGTKGIPVNNCADLVREGITLLENGSFLIKDPFGVSGSGNIHIRSTAMLNRIANHLKNQSDSIVEFVLEPFLPKKIDFSCHFYINKSGAFRLVALQIMNNVGVNYMGSSNADKDFYNKLDKARYFHTVEAVAKQLFADGYYGEVCLDSMVLASDEIVPIVEINARKSMGLINYRLDQYLSQWNLHGRLCILNVGFAKPLCTSYLLDVMDKNHILWTPNNGSGLILLGINAARKGFDKGRFYLCCAADTRDKHEHLIQKMKTVLLELSYKVY